MWALQALCTVARLRRPALSEVWAGSLFKEPVEADRCKKAPAVWCEFVLPALLAFLLEHLKGTMAVTNARPSMPQRAKVRH